MPTHVDAMSLEVIWVGKQVDFAQPIRRKLAAPVNLMALCPCGAQLATLFTE